MYTKCDENHDVYKMMMCTNHDASKSMQNFCMQNVSQIINMADDITNPNGTLIDSLMTTHGFKQLISDATHILPQSLSCINLIFTDHPNYVIDCGTHPSLNKNCHHQITFCKLNLKVEYPPPYQRLKNQIMVQLKELLNL